MGFPVFPHHPPVSVILKGVVEAVTQVLEFVPSFIFVLETAFPFSMSPGVSDAQDLQVDVLEIFNSLETIGMVKENTLRAVTIMLIAVVVLLTVRTTN